MGFLISPGVQVREYEVAPNNLTTSSSPVGFAGKFEWGPAESLVSVNTKTSLKQVFGAPSEDNAIDWFTCANFLDYSSNLITVRCINDGYARNATVGCYNTLESFNAGVAPSERITNEMLISYYDNKDEYDALLAAKEDKVKYAKEISDTDTGAYAGLGYDVDDTTGKTAVEQKVYDDYEAADIVYSEKNEIYNTAYSAYVSAVTDIGYTLEDDTAISAIVSKDLATLESERDAKVDAYDAAVEAINNDDTLTTEEKEEQIAGLTTEKEDRDFAINAVALKNAHTAMETAKQDRDAVEIDQNLKTYYNRFKEINTTIGLFGDLEKKFKNLTTEKLVQIRDSSCLIKNNSDWTNKYASGTADGQASLGEFAAKYPSDMGNNIGVYMVDGSGYGQVSKVEANVDAFIYTEKDNGGIVEFDPSPYGDEYTATGTIVLNLTDLDYQRKVGNETFYKISGVTLTNKGKYISPPKAKFPKPKDAKNSNSVPVARVSLWQYANTFMTAPGTSNYVKQRGGKDDELHIVVVDETGALTGTKGAVLESFANVSKASDAKYDDGTSSYYVNVLRDKSSWVTWLNHPTGTSNWGSKARNTTFDSLTIEDSSGERTSYVGRFAGGYSGTKYVDVYDKYKGWDLFADPERTNVSVIMSGNASSAEQKYLVDLCEARKDCVVVLSPLYSDVVGLTDTSIITNNILRTRNSLGDSTYAFFDCNWKYMYDMYNDVYRWVPCNADVAGIMARTDDNYAAWWSPAGLNRGKLLNVVKLAWNPSGDERDVMYEAAINAICTFLAEGTVLFGDKTMISRISPLANINARRCLIILEKTIARAAKNLLFEFNDTSSRVRFIQMVEPFLETVRSGRGITDFMLICDDTNNPPEIVDQNAFVGDIYIKPTKTINFIQLNFYAVAASVEFNEIVGNV